MPNSSDSHRQRQRNLARQRLNEEIQDLLISESSHSYSFITAIEQRIRQFHLDSQTQPHELINEAYLRAQKVIDRGEHIANPKGWIRITVLHIIQEKSRHQQKQRPTDPNSHMLETEAALPETDDSGLELEQRWRLLELALGDLQQIKPEIAQLMHWRLIEQLQWKEVQQRLVALKGKAPSETTLRKRASRSKRLLRKLYHKREEQLLATRRS